MDGESEATSVADRVWFGVAAWLASIAGPVAFNTITSYLEGHAAWCEFHARRESCCILLSFLVAGLCWCVCASIRPINTLQHLNRIVFLFGV